MSTIVLFYNEYKQSKDNYSSNFLIHHIILDKNMAFTFNVNAIITN